MCNVLAHCTWTTLSHFERCGKSMHSTTRTTMYMYPSICLPQCRTETNFLWIFRFLIFSIVYNMYFGCCSIKQKIVAAFRGMHVLPAKHSYASVTDGQTDGRTDRQTGGRTDRHTDGGQSDPYVSLCFAGDTKSCRKTFKTKLFEGPQYLVELCLIFGILTRNLTFV